MSDPAALESVHAFLGDAMNRNNFLLTHQRDGGIYSVQITAVVEPDFSVRIRTDNDALKAQHIRANPDVSVLFVEKSKERGTKNVMIRGSARIATDDESVDAYFGVLKERFGFALDRSAPHLRNSGIITIAPSFLRGEGFFSGDRARETLIWKPS